MKKNYFLHFALKYRTFYKVYLFYNLYIRNLKYLLKKSYSQFEEDLFLKTYFKNKKDGFFIDIGCYHPFKGNNTYLLYKSGWSGINIDLNQLGIDLFNIARPRDKNICTAISNKDGFVEYYLPNNNPLSTEITIDRKFSKILEEIHGNQYEIFKTKSMTWGSLENEYKKFFKDIDFFKIDIEGSDLEVLKSINLNKLKVKLIMIEASTFNSRDRKETINYLNSKNFTILFDNNLNIIFENRSLE